MDVILFILIFQLLQGIQGLSGHVDWLFACCLKMFKKLVQLSEVGRLLPFSTKEQIKDFTFYMESLF